MPDTGYSIGDPRQSKGIAHFDKLWSALFIGYRFEIVIIKKLGQALGSMLDICRKPSSASGGLNN